MRAKTWTMIQRQETQLLKGASKEVLMDVPHEMSFKLSRSQFKIQLTSFNGRNRIPLQYHLTSIDSLAQVSNSKSITVLKQLLSKMSRGKSVHCAWNFWEWQNVLSLPGKKLENSYTILNSVQKLTQREQLNSMFKCRNSRATIMALWSNKVSSTDLFCILKSLKLLS